MQSKAVYLTRSEAKQLTRKGRHQDGSMKPYRCDFCARWHLGHHRSRQVTRRAAA